MWEKQVPRYLIAYLLLAATIRGMKTLGPLLLLAALLLAAPARADFTEQQIENSVVDTCQQAVQDGLKDPDSAKFNGWQAWPVTKSLPPAGMSYNPSAGDKYYSSGGMVNAKNGFGGYVGNQPWVCDAIVTTDGKIHARANPMADLLGGGN